MVLAQSNPFNGVHWYDGETVALVPKIIARLAKTTNAGNHGIIS